MDVLIVGAGPTGLVLALWLSRLGVGIRIIDPVMKGGTPVYQYEPHTWGPKEVERVTPPGGWIAPVLHPNE